MVDPSRPVISLLQSLTPHQIQVHQLLKNDYPQLDDHTLGRFLRARKADYPKCKIMIDKYLAWRQQFGTDKIASFEFSQLEQVRRFYPHGYHKTDRQGRPIYIERYGQLNMKELWKITTPDRMLQHYVQGYQHLVNHIYPSCTWAAGHPVEQSLTILDLGGSSMKLMSKQIYKFIKLASSISQDYYPEILGRMFILNTPMLFSMVWKVVKPMLDKKTREKISMEGSRYQSKLLELVAPENLPEFLGGVCRCEGGCLSSGAGPWNEFPGQVPASVPQEVSEQDAQEEEEKKEDKENKEIS